MAKSLLTGSELRHAAKQRLKRHREAMSLKGYKTVSVFMGEPLRAELKRLGKDHGLSRHDALEHIYRGYLASIDINPCSPEPVIDIKSVTSNKDKGKDSKQLEMFVDPEPVPDLPAKDNPATAATPDAAWDTLTEQQQKAKRDNFILDNHKQGGRGGKMTLKQIAQGLEDAKIKTSTGLDKWVTGNVDQNFRTIMENQGIKS